MVGAGSNRRSRLSPTPRPSEVTTLRSSPSPIPPPATFHWQLRLIRFWFSCCNFNLYLGLGSYFLAIMAETSIDLLLKGSSGRNTRGLLRITILLTIAAAAVASRLFSVIRMYGLNWLLDSLLTHFQDSKVLFTNVRSP